MITYAALLRGIGPMNQNMRNEKLRGVFEKLGFKNVQTVISSGNVIFTSNSKNARTLETKLERAFPKYLGFESTTIIRSKEELEKLIKKDPFKGKTHGSKTYLIVTFLKEGGELFNVVDTTASKTPDFMLKLEKEHGKAITTRTWKTVQRILAKMP